MTASRIALAALLATASLVALGCSIAATASPAGATTISIADDVFGVMADGETSNQTIRLTGTFDPVTGAAALQSAGERFMRVDETGVEHATDAEVAAALGRGLSTPNYVADPEPTDAGLELYVDTKGWVPEPMRLTFRRILDEELTAAGLRDVSVVVADLEASP